MTYGWLGLFGAGVMTFATPCILPLVPVYLSALVGSDIRDIAGLKKGTLLLRAGLFAVGFLLVFVLLGMAASSLGAFLVEHRNWLQVGGGILILIFGLHFLGLVRLGFLQRTVRADDRRLQTRFGAINAVLMGIVFAAGWSPCAGPILGSVLTYTASRTADPWLGAAYLAAYGSGFALPLLVVAAFAGVATRWLRKISPWLGRIEKVIGTLLVVVALSMLAGGLEAGTGGAPAAGAGGQQLRLVKNGEPTMVIFTSRNCHVCQRMKPLMLSITRQCDGKRVRVKTIDLAAAGGREYIGRFHLVATPTFVFLDGDGREVARLVGEQSEDTLKQALSALRGEPCPGLGLLEPGGQSSPLSFPEQERDSAACSRNPARPDAGSSPEGEGDR